MKKEHSLSKRLFTVLMVFSLLFSLAIGVIITVASFSTYEKAAAQSLSTEATDIAQSLQDKGSEDRLLELQNLPTGLVRITYVGEDGTVLYDSKVGAAELGNHSDRAEIQDAIRDGEAVVERQSETMHEDSLYAAVALNDGSVIRLSEERRSLASFIGEMAPTIVLVTVIVVVVAYILARVLSRRIVKPMNSVDLAHPSGESPYSEIQPLMDRIEQQRKELVKSNDELRRAANLRREFTANVSHEMKSPLQVIGGYAELMSNGMVSEEDVPKFANLILTEAESMRLLVDDVLTLSHLDEHSRVGDDSPDVDLYDVAASAVSRLDSKAGDRNLYISGVHDDAVVKGNAQLLEQMVYNLVDNAVRYTNPDGRIRVRLGRDGDYAVLSVDDDGVGIPEEYRERVFERFFRVDESRSRETGGTGLGLAIVKHSAEDHGGTVVAEESEWGGASLVVRIPLAESAR